MATIVIIIIIIIIIIMVLKNMFLHHRNLYQSIEYTHKNIVFICICNQLIVFFFFFFFFVFFYSMMTLGRELFTLPSCTNAVLV